MNKRSNKKAVCYIKENGKKTVLLEAERKYNHQEENDKKNVEHFKNRLRHILKEFGGEIEREAKEEIKRLIKLPYTEYKNSRCVIDGVNIPMMAILLEGLSIEINGVKHSI